MATMPSGIELAPILVMTCAEPALGDRLIDQLRQELRRRDPHVDIVDLDCANYMPGQLAVLLSPSLFDESRAVIARNVERSNIAFRDEIVEYMAHPDPASVLILRHNGGNGGKKILEAARRYKLPTHNIAKVSYPNEKARIVQDIVRSARRKITSEAVAGLVDACGSDLRELIASTTQLLDDIPGMITDAHVYTYFSGRVEANAFQVADAVIAKNAARAVELMRHALATGCSAVAINAAIAAKLRAMTQVLGQRSGRIPAKTKLSSWQVDRAKRDLARWKAPEIERAVEIMAQSDADVKGGSRDPNYALERAILAVCSPRSR
ncbi:DNA polymerase III subunit delta [Trueperella sp. LYQ143]|uniref:DNA polymerase III subunit delta n=1 Tax=unclassified Trueperella TaxID=2630174 RepID=UPI003983D2AF